MNIGQKIKSLELNINKLQDDILNLKRILDRDEVLFQISEDEEYVSIQDIKYLKDDTLIIVLKFKNIKLDKPSFYIMKGEIHKNPYNKVSYIYFLNETFTKIPLVGEGIEEVENWVMEISPLSNLIYLIPNNSYQFIKKRHFEMILEIGYNFDEKSFSILNFRKIDMVEFYVRDMLFDKNEEYLYILESYEPLKDKDTSDKNQICKSQVSCYINDRDLNEFILLRKNRFPSLDIDWNSFLGWMDNGELIVINSSNLNLETINYYGKPLFLKPVESEEVKIIIETNKIQNELEEIVKDNQIIKYLKFDKQNLVYSSISSGSYYRILSLFPGRKVRIRIIEELNKIMIIPIDFGKSNRSKLNSIFEPYGLFYLVDKDNVLLSKDESDEGVKLFGKLNEIDEIPVYFEKKMIK